MNNNLEHQETLLATSYRHAETFGLPEIVCDLCNRLIIAPVVAVAYDMAYCTPCHLRAVGEGRLADAIGDLPVDAVVASNTTDGNAHLIILSVRRGSGVGLPLLRISSAILAAGWWCTGFSVAMDSVEMPLMRRAGGRVSRGS